MRQQARVCKASTTHSQCTHCRVHLHRIVRYGVHHIVHRIVLVSCIASCIVHMRTRAPEQAYAVGQHVEIAVLLVPATSAVWDAGLRAWAALRTPKERLSRSRPQRRRVMLLPACANAAHFARFN